MKKSNDKHSISKTEELKSILDRTVLWNNGCDTKTGIILALIGVLLTMVLTNEGLKTYYRIIVLAFDVKAWVYLFALLCAVLCLLFGLIKLISVLFASINITDFNQPALETDSKLFFGSISNNKFSEYKEKFLSMSEDDYINDLLSQIYINSKIANIKFKRYNLGVKTSILGFCGFILVFLLGIKLFI